MNYLVASSDPAGVEAVALLPRALRADKVGVPLLLLTVVVAVWPVVTASDFVSDDAALLPDVGAFVSAPSAGTIGGGACVVSASVSSLDGVGERESTSLPLELVLSDFFGLAATGAAAVEL